MGTDYCCCTVHIIDVLNCIGFYFKSVNQVLNAKDHSSFTYTSSLICFDCCTNFIISRQLVSVISLLSSCIHNFSTDEGQARRRFERRIMYPLSGLLKELISQRSEMEICTVIKRWMYWWMILLVNTLILIKQKYSITSF